MTHLDRLTLLSTSFVATFAMLCPASALAGGTKLRNIKTFGELSKGETKNAIIAPKGTVIVGYTDQSADIPGTELVLSCQSAGSKAYAATGMPAAVYEVSQGKGTPTFRELSKLPGVAVTAVAKDNKGRVFAATLPGSKIYQIAKGKKPKVFADLKAGRIWDLQMHRGRLYAATGPEGRVFSISASGKATLVLDTEAVDVLTLLSLPDALLAGTANQARIYQVTDKKEGLLLREFDGKEVRALRSKGNQIYATVNAFESRGLGGLGKMVQKVNESSVTGAAPIRDQLKEESRKASGTLYRMTLQGPAKASSMAESAWESLFEKDDQYFTDLAVVEGGKAAMVTSSQEGKVYRVRGFAQPTLIADFDQQQASAICQLSSGAMMAFTAGPASVHRLAAAQAKSATYLTEPLDAGLPAQYGMLRLRGKDKLSVRTRSGPSEEIDGRWTPWRTVALKQDGIFRAGSINAKRMRFLQVEVRLDSVTASLDTLEFFYRPFNLAPAMKEITIAAPKFDAESDEAPETMQEVKWSADARDDDDLHFDLAIRPVQSRSGWTPLNRGEPVTEETFELNTQSFPDGLYELSVTASDEPSNGSAQAKKERRVSEPFLIDKARPGFSQVKRKGMRITGNAIDKLSRIRDVSYQIDNRGYRLASPVDGLYDEHQEAFEIELPAQTPANARILIRTRDEQGNQRKISLP